MGWLIFVLLLFTCIISTGFALAMTPDRDDWRENPADPLDGVEVSAWTLVTGQAFKEAIRNSEREDRRPAAVDRAWVIAVASGTFAIIALIALLIL